MQNIGTFCAAQRHLTASAIRARPSRERLRSFAGFDGPVVGAAGLWRVAGACTLRNGDRLVKTRVLILLHARLVVGASFIRGNDLT
jgi:hypothetical protein